MMITSLNIFSKSINGTISIMIINDVSNTTKYNYVNFKP